MDGSSPGLSPPIPAGRCHRLLPPSVHALSVQAHLAPYHHGTFPAHAPCPENSALNAPALNYLALQKNLWVATVPTPSLSLRERAGVREVQSGQTVPFAWYFVIPSPCPSPGGRGNPSSGFGPCNTPHSILDAQTSLPSENRPHFAIHNYHNINNLKQKQHYLHPQNFWLFRRICRWPPSQLPLPGRGNRSSGFGPCNTPHSILDAQTSLPSENRPHYAIHNYHNINNLKQKHHCLLPQFF